MISNLPTIIPAKRISSSEVLQGKVIPDIDRLLLFSPHDFEAMVLEWATEFLKGKYSDVKNIGGAGDKGRDVIGYYPDNSIDIYQCKHYKDPITPTIMYVELGKLCLYTFNKDYPTPKTYYVVSPKGCGGALSDLIDNPIELRKKLIDNWSIYCESKITSTGKVELKGAFRKHVEQFDFSIVKVMQPLTLISQYKETSHYPTRFGGGLVKYRSVLPKADENIDVRELVYTEQLLKVYSEKEATKISTVSELKTKSVDLEEHFNEQRNSFYCAESLDKFSRDNFPQAHLSPFEELKNDSDEIIKTNLASEETSSGWKKLETSVKMLQIQTFASSPLSQEIKPIDKRGMAHIVANDGKRKWMK